MEDLKNAARRGASASERAKCNVNQSGALGILFRELLFLCVAWDSCFAAELNTPEVSSIVHELSECVDAAIRLLDGYNARNWLTAAVFKQENAEGFSQAAFIIWKHVQILNNYIGNVVQEEKRDIVMMVKEKVSRDMLLINHLLNKGAVQDREELARKGTDYVEHGSFLQRFFRRLIKLKNALRHKLSQGSLMVIHPRDISFTKMIGKGSFSKVFKGRWLGMIPIAVKRSEEDRIHDREVRILRGFQPHPNIVQVVGVSEHPIRWLIMELKDGNLHERLRESPLTRHQALNVMLQIASGMSHLHGLGICYRDLKPGNILVTRFLEICLVDFGHAKQDFSSLAEDNTARVGTVPYMALEVLRDLRYSKKADVWSFAVVCSELLTGALDWLPRVDISSRIDALARGERPPLPEECPLHLRALIERCWHEDPEQRPGFTEIQEELWSIKEQQLIGRAAVHSQGARLSRVSTDRFASFSSFSSDTESLPSETSESGVDGLDITGQTMNIGSKLKASWSFTSGTTACLVQWIRRSTRNDIQVVKLLLTTETSSEYSLTSDDYECCIGVRLLPILLEGGMKATRESCYTCPTPVSCDERMQAEVDEYVVTEYKSFKVKIDGNGRWARNQLNVYRGGFQLWWNRDSSKNYRMSSESEEVSMKLVGNRAMVITIKGRSSVINERCNQVKFDSIYERDLAALLMRTSLPR